MPTEKTLAFPVETEWFGGRLTRCHTYDAGALDVATPPVFPHGMPGFWSPEDMLVGAASSCYVLTLVSACEARAIPLHGLRVKAVGHVGQRADGRFGFESIELRVTAKTSPEKVERLVELAQRVERSCIVATALEVPLHVEIDIRELASVAGA